MSDYSDWFESTFGVAQYDHDGGDEGGEGDADRSLFTSARYERDAVLCMVDCRPEMFATRSPPPATRETTSSPREDAEARLVKAEPGTAASRATGATPSDAPTGDGDVKREQALGETAHRQREEEGSHGTGFSRALKAILQLYQEKIITTERDILGLVLFHTRERYNTGNFSGVYVVQEFHMLNAQSIREVEELSDAGRPDSEAFAAFQETIGSANGTPSSATTTLSDALWAAQHMFMHRRLQQVAHKRIFLFTNDDEPTRGSGMERQRSYARAKDLAESGVELEVFSLPAAVVAAPFREGRFWQPLLEHAAVAATQQRHIASATASPAVPYPTRAYAGSVHQQNDQENPLEALSDAIRVKAHPQVPFLRLPLRLGVRCDGVHPGSGEAGLGGRSVKKEGQRDDEEEEGDEISLVEKKPAAMQKVPTIRVSVFTPIRPAVGQPTTKIDAATNRRVARKTELVVKSSSTTASTGRGRGRFQTAGAEESDEGEGEGEEAPPLVVSAEEVSLSTQAGGQRVFFSAMERKAMAMAVTGVCKGGMLLGENERGEAVPLPPVYPAAPPGVTILCFRPLYEVLQHEYVVKYSSFLHIASPDAGSSASLSYYNTTGVANSSVFQDESLKLFLLVLHKMRLAGLVAIAELVLRSGAAPRLVALIPSFTTERADDDEGEGDAETTTESKHLLPSSHSARAASLCARLRRGFDPTQVPVQGTGFYMMPMPYAEDLREVPHLSAATSGAAGGGGGRGGRSTVKAETAPRGRTKVEPKEETTTSSSSSRSDGYSREDLSQATALIRAMKVSYDITAVPNPSVQRQLQVLQRLALRQPSLGDGGNGEAPQYRSRLKWRKCEPLQEGGRDEKPSHDDGAPQVDLPGWKDWSLPDEEGLRQHDALLRSFQASVLCGVAADDPSWQELMHDDGAQLRRLYDPDWLCMSASSARATSVASPKVQDVLPPSVVVAPTPTKGGKRLAGGKRLKSEEPDENAAITPTPLAKRARKTVKKES